MLRSEDQVVNAPRLPLARRVVAELIGSALLAAVVIGSGIAAERLSPGDTGLQLLENAVATGAGLVALILTFGPVSGAHFNPAITLVDRALGGLGTRDSIAYVVAQILGCCAGALLANAMFARPTFETATQVRTGGPLWLAETVATFGLVLLVFALTRSGRSAVAPFAVAAYITGAYTWTASTSFANPAITLGRTLSDSFAGIAPASAPAFVAFQLLGSIAAIALVRFLYPDAPAAR